MVMGKLKVASVPTPLFAEDAPDPANVDATPPGLLISKILLPK
jgi:hypothetical protein